MLRATKVWKDGKLMKDRGNLDDANKIPMEVKTPGGLFFFKFRDEEDAAVFLVGCTDRRNFVIKIKDRDYHMINSTCKVEIMAHIRYCYDFDKAFYHDEASHIRPSE